MILPTVTVYSIGLEAEPVAVVENFAPDPQSLRTDSVLRDFEPSDDHYPGVKAPVPEDYLSGQWAVLAAVFKDVFDITGRVSLLDLTYALVAKAPGALTLEQRLPHVDALQPGRLALIHYLVPERSDGTGFFRHRSTGFETVDHARSTTYFTKLNEDLHTHGPLPVAYPNDSTPIFERTRHFEGRYNRALIYRSRLLHSGAIGPDTALSSNPSTGRLTITGFFAAD
jgi:hypothetical protein